MRSRWSPLLAGAALLGVGCASSPPPTAPLHLEPAPLTSVGGPVIKMDVHARYQELLGATEAGNNDLAYSIVLELLDRCGTAPLTRRALLLTAAAELDPRSSSTRPDLAMEYAAQVLLAPEPDPWTRRLAESLYLVAHRMGGVRGSEARNQDVQEVRWRAERAAGRTPAHGCATEHASVLATVGSDVDSWPTEGATSASADPGASSPPGRSGALPPPVGSSYPAVITELRQQLSALEQELERLRRIASP